MLQVGIRAYSLQEAQLIESDDRITTFFARDTQHPPVQNESWKKWLEALRTLSGPVHLTIDIDGLDGALVPSTGTPVPGGLSFWQVQETVETLFSAPNATVISADVNEIVAQEGSSLTQFTAASIATKVIACHVGARKQGRWNPTNNDAIEDSPSQYFQTWERSASSSN